VQNNASHLGFAQSPFFPKTAQEWAKHQAEYAQERMGEEKEKLRSRIEEREVRRKGEGDRAEDRAVLEREVQRLKGFVHGGDVTERLQGLEIEGREEEGGVSLHGEEEEQGEDREEQLAEARAGKAKDNTEIEVTEVDTQIESETEPETESSEQVDSGTNNDGNESKKKRKKRGKKKKGSKAKNTTKIEGVEAGDGSRAAKPANIDQKENVKPTTSTTSTGKPGSKPTAASKKTTADLAANLLGSLANDPLLKGVLAGTAKPPNSSLWRAFTQSNLYNPSGSGPALNAMFASLRQPGRTPVLSAPTSIWAGDEHLKPEGRRDPITGEHRSAWPNMSEVKAEGQYRKDAGKDRRLPLPRMDIMTKEAVIREAGGQEVVDQLTDEGRDAVCRELGKKTGEEIAWMDREPVRFSDFDCLESVSKERWEENTRRREGELVCGPSVQGHGAQGAQGAMGGSRGHGLNMGLRGGFSQSGVGRRQTGPQAPLPDQPKAKVVNPEAICYGADGPGDGKVPPPGGWVFDEEFLKQRGDWSDLLENHL
jgi:hypothetical protein